MTILKLKITSGSKEITVLGPFRAGEATFSIFSSGAAFYFAMNGVSQFGVDFLKYSFVIWFLLISSNLLFFLFSNFKLNDSGDVEIKTALTFLLSVFAMHMLVNLTTHFTWWEFYVIPLIPLALIFALYVFGNNEISIKKSLIIIGLLLIFSVWVSKTSYDQQGLRWENAEEAVNSKLVDPREVDFLDWAWIPYFFQERSFKETLAGVGGDKKLIGNIHTWWENYEYKRKDWKTKLSFISPPCINREPLAFVKEIGAVSVFRTIEYCEYIDLR